MASCPAASRQEGFASVPAMLTSLVVAMISIGLMSRGLGDLQGARRDFERTDAEYRLASAQAEAGDRLLQGVQGGRLTWTVPSGAGAVTILAEPEAGKAALDGAGDFDLAQLAELGAEDPAAARAGLAALVRDRTVPADIAAADAGGRWKSCAPSAISPFGQGGTPRLLPLAGPMTADARTPLTGQVWRVQATAGGWRDERLIRFTGDPRRPAVTITRQFFRIRGEDRPCEAKADSM